MAYGNWGAFVYKDGQRMQGWEDQTPYKEEILAPGYHQVFGLVEGLNPHHAVLGSSRVRLCGYKSYPVLFLDGKEVTLDEFKIGESDSEECEWSGKIADHVFTAREYNGNMLDLYLKEPGGSVWNATCGYEYGAGHMD